MASPQGSPATPAAQRAALAGCGTRIAGARVGARVRTLQFWKPVAQMRLIWTDGVIWEGYESDIECISRHTPANKHCDIFQNYGRALLPYWPITLIELATPRGAARRDAASHCLSTPVRPPGFSRLLSAPTKENLLIIRVTIDSGRHFLSLPSACPHPAPKDAGMFYIHADPPKPLPPIPVRVSRRSQLTAALRQHARPIVIEDQELAGSFVRLLRARQLRLWGLGEFAANTMSCGIDHCYGANVEAHWYVGRYVLPGNVQKVILKPKTYGIGRLPRHLQA